MPKTIQNEQGLTRILLLIGLLFTIAISAVYLIQPAFIGSTNNRTTDVVMSFAKAKPASGTVVVVDIDEYSLAHYGQWPWPRNQLAQLLHSINASAPSSIGLDLILTEPDRISSDNHKGSTNSDFAAIQPELPDHDKPLADVLGKGPFVLGYQFLFNNGPKADSSCKLHPPGIVWINRTLKWHDQVSFFKAQGVVCNLQTFSDAVTRSGFLNATPDADGVLRRMPMLIQSEDRLYPSLTLAILMQHLKSSQIGIMSRENGSLDLMVGNKSTSVDTQGNMIIRFSRDTVSKHHISAGDLLDGKISADYFKGKIVLIGSSAAGLERVYLTNARPVHSDVDVQAQVLENLLSSQNIVRTRQFLLWEVMIGLLVAILTCVTIARMGILASAAVCMTLMAGIWVGMGLFFQARGYLLSPLLPSVLVVFNYVCLTIFKTWKNQLIALEGADNALILLKSSEKDLYSIIKAVPDIIFRLDPAGRITFISPAIAKYNAPPGALLGQEVFSLVAPEDKPKAQYRLNEKRTGERATRDLEIRLLLPHKQDGNSEDKGYFTVSAEGLYQGDNPCPEKFIGTQGIIRDITNQKKLEEKLLQAKKMEAVGSLAAGVAHDLNNILAGLVTYPELLLLELPQDSPMHAKISIIQKSGQRAAAIVQDLLTLARHGINSSEVINLNSVILDYLTSLEYNSERKHHPNTTLESNLAPDLLNIKGSKVHLTKALTNILKNAAEAMPAGGTIRLSTCNRCLDTSLKLYEEIPAGDYVCITIADEGIGISNKDLQRIFEPFYSKKSMRRSGSGLGMTVIWATIKDHDGYIDIESREGEGTCFILYLPVTREQAVVSNQRIVLEDYLGTERILIVDDVPEQRQVADNMLSKLGYKVEAVASGEAAVEYLQSHTADLIVLDMIMPGGIDGLETYTRITKFKPEQRAIITSGFSESERVKALRQLGAGSYVQKPYTLEKFGVAVRRELDR